MPQRQRRGLLPVLRARIYVGRGRGKAGRGVTVRKTAVDAPFINAAISCGTVYRLASCKRFTLALLGRAVTRGIGAVATFTLPATSNPTMRGPSLCPLRNVWRWERYKGDHDYVWLAYASHSTACWCSKWPCMSLSRVVFVFFPKYFAASDNSWCSKHKLQHVKSRRLKRWFFNHVHDAACKTRRTDSRSELTTIYSRVPRGLPAFRCTAPRVPLTRQPRRA